MSKSNSSDIFNYDFNWVKPKGKKSKGETKDECCKKYKKKGENKCKSCPKRWAFSLILVLLQFYIF